MDNQKVRILINKGSRADMCPEMVNALQSQPQQADLNLHANLPAIRHAPCSFTGWACAASLAGNQPLYSGTMPLKVPDDILNNCMQDTNKLNYEAIVHTLVASRAHYL